MLVAAHHNDLRAAASHGLATAFVFRPAEHGPAQAAGAQATREYTFAVADFGALADALGA
jgi:2-haloacid dehalogenase